jgi:drug/metabolite transporter (DMT)-like permease
LYIAMLGCFLLMSGIMANKGSTPSNKVMFIFISTLLFALIYSIAALIVYIRKRKRRY